MVFKKILAILFTGMVLCTGLSVSAYAETTYLLNNSGVAPAYEKAYNVQSNLSISGYTAYCTSETYCADTVVSITVEQTLQKQGFLWLWSDVKDANWTTTKNMNAVTFRNTKTGLSESKYRLKSVFTITDKYGKTETITEYSAVKST